MIKKWVCFIIFIIGILIAIFYKKTHVVEIENGKISGKTLHKYYAYRGIKYATAKRFELPKPTSDEKWSDIKKFEDYRESCAQYDHITYNFDGMEDCLFLNVFVPKKVIESKELSPVIFFIHGGAFMFGGGKYYYPDHIMDHERMILVTINYRLGILGFLSTEDTVLPGNLGLKDQVEALKWVQRNIKVFNGDPSKVTIVGYSAGAGSAQLHYLSPLSNGLFNNAISHSGVALNPWVFMEKAKEKAHQVAEFMKCPQDNHHEMLNCLKEKPVKELVMLAKKFQQFLYNPFSPFGAVIEPIHESAFITENPKTLLKKGRFNHRPWLVSQTKDEGLYPGAEFYSNENYLQEIDEKWNEIIPSILHFNEETEDENKIIKASEKIRELYMGNKKINKENFRAFVNIMTDRLFKSKFIEAIRLQSKNSPTFVYHFLYKSVSGLAEFFGKTTNNIGTSHGEDVLLIFTHDLRSIKYSDDEKKMAQNLINMYYEFATTSVPKFNNKIVQQSHPEDVQFMEITSNTEYVMETHNETFGNAQFWTQIENLLHSNSYEV